MDSVRSPGRAITISVAALTMLAALPANAATAQRALFGTMADVMLGYDDPASFFDNPNYVGVTAGRYANRIVGGRFAFDGGSDQLTPTQPKPVAPLSDPASGRVLEVLSTEPDVQVYTGTFLDGSYVGKQGHRYCMGDGIALEPQKLPDSPNQPNFALAQVDPGKPYHPRMVYRLTTAR